MTDFHETHPGGMLRKYVENHGRRPSSFYMHDPERVFRELALKSGDVMIDLGCGVGEYSRIAADRVGPSGSVYALDRLDETIVEMRRQASAEGRAHLHALVADITRPLPLESGMADVCFLCTVLHSIFGDDSRKTLFGEMRRVLKPGGRAVIVECRKESTTFGPPLGMRLSEEEVDRFAMRAGFSKVSSADLGFSYLVAYRR